MLLENGYSLLYYEVLWQFFNLIIVQEVETYSVYYISVFSSTCFGC